MIKNDLFLRALKGETGERPPVWMMRHAGRYLPEFQEIKKKYDFFTRCQTPELASEITVQPIRRYGMDAAILFTDIFVGFHSPEGWTVLLNGIAKHLGLPSQENFVMLFIATFPVILATIFKYWIFRYLNRVSPSSVATLKGMNGSG